MSQLLEKSLVLVVTLSMAFSMSSMYFQGVETVRHHSAHYTAGFLVNRIRYGVDLVSSNHNAEYTCILSLGADVSLTCNGQHLHLSVSEGNTSVSLACALPMQTLCSARLSPGVYTLRAAWHSNGAEITFQRMVN